MKKIILILCFLLSLGACKEENKTVEKEKPVVKIGASLPLSGNMAAIGNAAHRALIASVAKVNQNPNNKYRYELIVENDQMNPRYISSIAYKFLYKDYVDVIISYFSVAGRIVAPMAAKRKIINFNLGFGDDVLLGKYNFQNFLTVEAENDAVLAFLKKHNVTNVDLIYQNIGAADEFLGPLQEKLKEQNIDYTVHRFNKDERDFRILISQVKESPSTAVFIYAFEPEADILTQEIRLQKVKKIVAYNDGLPMTNNYALYEGFYNIGSISTPEKYRKEWGLEGQNAAYSIYLYDTMQIIAEAYENAKAQNIVPTADEVSIYLHLKPEYRGIAGKLRLDEKGQFHSRSEVSSVKNKKLVIEEQ